MKVRYEIFLILRLPAKEQAVKRFTKFPPHLRTAKKFLQKVEQLLFSLSYSKKKDFFNNQNSNYPVPP